MAGELKILKLDHRICWVIFIALYLFVIAVMIGTLTNKYWVELNPVVPAFVYKGSLIYVEEGLSQIPNLASPLNPFDLTHFTYEHVFCGACFVRDILNETLTPVSTWNLYHAWCSLFKRLWFGAGLFIVFEVIALLCLAFSIVFFVFFIKNMFYLRASLFAGGCLWASHYVAILGWIGVARVTFGDDCHDMYDGITSPILCAKDAPRLGLFLVIFLPFVMIPFFIIISYIKRHKLVHERRIGHDESSRNEGNERGESNSRAPMTDGSAMVKDF